MLLVTRKNQHLIGDRIYIMTNVIAERVKKVKLTKSQQKIAEYCIQNAEKVGMSSSMEIAAAIGVSDVSITRFARAIGYDGFTDLKNDIYNSMAIRANGGSAELSLVERAKLSKEKYGGFIGGTDYMKILCFNMERTLQQNNDETIDKAVDLLLNAEHKYVAGFRGCLGTATQCAWLMRFLVDHVISVTDEGPGAVGCIQDISDKDVLLLFSMSRYYQIDLNIVKSAQQRGAKICLVTNSILSPLAEYSDIVLLTEVKTASFFNSMAAVNMISEYLLTCIFQRCKDSFNERMEDRDRLTDYLRL